ncbi:hypothetical protein EI555_001653, partial [Monodon monoceros]
ETPKKKKKFSFKKPSKLSGLSFKINRKEGAGGLFPLILAITPACLIPKMDRRAKRGATGSRQAILLDWLELIQILKRKDLLNPAIFNNAAGPPGAKPAKNVTVAHPCHDIHVTNCHDIHMTRLPFLQPLQISAQIK